MKAMLLISVLFPMLCGLYMFVRPFEDRKSRNIFVFAVTCIESLLIFGLVFFGSDSACVILALDESVGLTLRMDGLSKVFCLIISVLWPIAVLYSFEYMSLERDENRFFAFYTITYGVVAGIALAENYFTLYLFYECLTLATLPLVMHEMDGKARFAGRRYIIYSMSGAAMSFIAMVIVLKNGSASFVPGGAAAVAGMTAQIVFLLGFFGFGAKAAVFPLHSWLPTAGVAPTPVTALLHAVAVVNSGLFAILRLTYYCVGCEVLAGTTAQTIAMGFACFTIVFGSAMALRNRNLKRRLAYSTVSNLSYVLLGATLMCPAGFAAALMHMVMHSVIKITLFFVAGALLCVTHHHCRNVEQYEGFGKKLPLLFIVFAISSLSLIGVPPFGGFTSKWVIAEAAAAVGTPMAIVGIAALCASAFLTGLYLTDVLIWAVWPRKDAVSEAPEEIHKPGWQVNTSLIILTVLVVLVSVFANRIYELLCSVAGLM